MSNLSDFTISEIKHNDKIIVLEDRELGLSIEIPFDNKVLVDALIIEAYSILLRYDDGTTEKKQFLE